MTAPDEQQLRTGTFVVLLGLAVTLVLAVFLGYVLMDSGSSDASIGSGLALFLLVPLSLPWVLLGAVLPLDLAVLLGLLVNAPLAAWWVSRRFSFTVLHPGYATGALVSGVLLLVTVASVGVDAWEQRDELSDRVDGILPLGPWTADGTEVEDPDCAFCVPEELSLRSTRITGSSPEEPTLRSLVDARMTRQGFTPDGEWECSDLADVSSRLCFRGYDVGDLGAFVRLYQYRDQDPELWVDVNRSG